MLEILSNENENTMLLQVFQWVSLNVVALVGWSIG